MKLAVLVLSLTVATFAYSDAGSSTSYTFNSKDYFADLYTRLIKDINDSPGFGVDGVGFNVPIKETGGTLVLDQGEVKSIGNITYTTPHNTTYMMFPAASTMYTIGRTVIEYRFFVHGNDTSYVPTGYVTYELSDVANNIFAAVFNKTDSYYVEVLTSKIASFGTVESIKLSDQPIEHLETYMQEISQLYRLDIAAEAASALEFYLDYNIGKMNTTQYVVKKTY